MVTHVELLRECLVRRSGKLARGRGTQVRYKVVNMSPDLKFMFE